MKKIVMIEDNEDHVLLIRQALQSGDLNISHFQDGMSAIQNFKEIKPALTLFLFRLRIVRAAPISALLKLIGVGTVPFLGITFKTQPFDGSLPRDGVNRRGLTFPYSAKIASISS